MPLPSHWDKVKKYTDGFYTNDLYGEGQTVVNANYRGNFPRLVELKKAYDPTNLFRLNANVQPAA